LALTPQLFALASSFLCLSSDNGSLASNNIFPEMDVDSSKNLTLLSSELSI
jgi:hypothetical protein